MSEPLIEKLEAAKCSLSDEWDAQGQSHNDAIDKAIALVQEHQAEQPQEVAAPVAVAVMTASIFGMAASKKRGVANGCYEALRAAGYKIVKGGE